MNNKKQTHKHTTNMPAQKIVTAGSVKRTFTCPHCNRLMSGNHDVVSSMIQRHIRFCEGMSESEMAFCIQAIGKSSAGMRHHTRLVNGNFQDYSPEVRLPDSLPPVHRSSPLRHEIVAPQILPSDEERAQIWAQLIADEDKETEKNKKKVSGSKKKKA